MTLPVEVLLIAPVNELAPAVKAIWPELLTSTLLPMVKSPPARDIAPALFGRPWRKRIDAPGATWICPLAALAVLLAERTSVPPLARSSPLLEMAAPSWPAP